MAHVSKFTAGSVGRLCQNYERRKDDDDDYIQLNNQEIDHERTHLNYNLAPDHDQVEFIRERVSQVHCLKRQDVKVMCDWIVTRPMDTPPELERHFFEETYNFLEDRYGKDNVISAYVHMDEVTPHIHFAFVPVVYDQKKDREKVSAKEAVSLYDLKSFHDDLDEYLQKALGHSVGVRNGATREGNKSIAELKRDTATQIVKDTHKKLHEAQEVLCLIKGKESLTIDHDELKVTVDHLGEEKIIFQRDINMREQKLKESGLPLVSLTKKQIDEIKAKVIPKGNRGDKLILTGITYKEISSLFNTASQVNELRYRENKLIKEKKSFEIYKNEELEAIANTSKESIYKKVEEIKKVRNLENKVTVFEKFLEAHPHSKQVFTEFKLQQQKSINENIQR